MRSKFLRVVLFLVVAATAFVFYARSHSSTVHVERTFAAPAETVWRLWNDPDSMKKWWGPKDYTAPVIKNDLRVGGTFLLSMKSAKGEMFWNTGVYTDVVPHARIVSSLSFSDENGNAVTGKAIPVPGVWPDAVTVTVEFRESNGQTTVSITETGIPLIMKLFAGMGWEQQFDKFAALL